MGHSHHGHHHHGHGHDHGHPGLVSFTAPKSADHRAKEKTRLWWAIGVTTTAMVVEIVGGLLSGSLALISDAGHMLTHSAALGVSLVAMVLAARPTRPERSFGLYRVEVLAALFNAITLIVITGFIAHEAYERLREPTAILAWQMFGVAVFGLVVNLGTAFILHGGGMEDLNFRSAFFHMIGDTLSSVVIVIGALVIRATNWFWLDPVLSVVICLVILYWAWGLLRDSVHILMESAPEGLSVSKVLDGLRGRFDPVDDVVDIHMWTISSGMHAMTAHVRLKRDLPLAEQSRLAHDMRHYVSDEFSIGHAVFQFEAAADHA
ncbi:MAG: cation diffusion facilitator family transporter [Deltaproteobacteria bacterium]|nr:cation diffusion facilitator family transporter [Deltaproteobacteria bacterium]